MIGKMKNRYSNGWEILMTCFLVSIMLSPAAWAIDPDIYEEDNSVYQAKPIIVDGETQEHTFHNGDVEDWIFFEAISSEENLDREYEIKLTNPENKCDCPDEEIEDCCNIRYKIDVYASLDVQNVSPKEITTRNDDGSMTGDVDFSQDGLVYVKITSYALEDDIGTGYDIEYDIEVNSIDAPELDARIIGIVFENVEINGSSTRVPIANANIRIKDDYGTEKWSGSSSDGCNNTFCHPGLFGLYITPRQFSTGNYTISAEVDGYSSNPGSLNITMTGEFKRHDIEMTPVENKPLFIFYVDRDRDGLGSNSPIPSKVYCKNCTQLDGYADNAEDSDDNSPPPTTSSTTTSTTTSSTSSSTTTTTQDSDSTTPDPSSSSSTSSTTTTSVTTTTTPVITPSTTTCISSIFYEDADNDGYSGKDQNSCSRPVGWKTGSELKGMSKDPDDNDPSVYPGALEECDGKDNDGNGKIDECCETYYKDEDQDGHSDGSVKRSCSRPKGYALESELFSIQGDCDDSDPAKHPEQHWYRDRDKDGFSDGLRRTACDRPGPDFYLEWELRGITGDCDDEDPEINPDAEETCNDKDDNCDGEIDECCLIYCNDADGDGHGDPNDERTRFCSPPSEGYVEEQFCDDCDDSDPLFFVSYLYYGDSDNDGYGDAEDTQEACEPPDGYVENNADCDDTDSFINPEAQEIEDNDIDDNCNGAVDEKADVYEEDDHPDQASVIILNDTPDASEETQAEDVEAVALNDPPDTLYEKNDLSEQTDVMTLNDTPDAEPHNFHDAGDEDWMSFYGIDGEIYIIELINLGERSDAVIELYFKQHNSRMFLVSADQESEDGNKSLEWLCFKDGIYQVRIANRDSEIFGKGTEYDLRISRAGSECAAQTLVTGTIRDASSGKPVGDAWIKTDQNDTAISLSDGTYQLVGCGEFRKISVQKDQRLADMLVISHGPISDIEVDIHLDNSLNDAVKILQYFTGMSFDLLPDPNADGKIGLDDVIHILRQLSDTDQKE